MLERGRETIFLWLVRVIVLITAMPVHECAHALAAQALGDDTAKKSGRLTLNPLRHLDPFGSALIIFAGFGWAKPVPVNTRKLRRPRRDMALTAAAGPLSNVLLAAVFMTALKLILFDPTLRDSRPAWYLFEVLEIMLGVNLSLAVFNLLPIPPLDGYKLFGALLPPRLYFRVMDYEQYVMIGIFALMMASQFLGWPGVFSAPIEWGTGYLLRLLDTLTGALGRIF